MEKPELKHIGVLTPNDFERHPLWVGVQHYDTHESWYEPSYDQMYRPWLGQPPFQERSRFSFFLVCAIFELADRSAYPGFFNPTSPEWDEPLPPRKMRDGNYTKPLQWSARRGGSPLSVMALHRPVIFLDGRGYDFHLRRKPEMRKKQINEFYAAIGKPPNDVFPVRFYADPKLYSGIMEGKMEGFYSFPLDEPFEIDTGVDLLVGDEQRQDPGAGAV